MPDRPRPPLISINILYDGSVSVLFRLVHLLHFIHPALHPCKSSEIIIIKSTMTNPLGPFNLLREVKTKSAIFLISQRSPQQYKRMISHHIALTLSDRSSKLIFNYALQLIVNWYGAVQLNVKYDRSIRWRYDGPGCPSRNYNNIVQFIKAIYN